MFNFLNKLMVWQKDIIALAVLNIFILTQIAGLSDIAGIVFLAVFPGLLIQRAMVFKAEHVWERIVHTVALSISFVMFAGLMVNTLLPALNILRPLEQLPVLLSFDVILLFLIAVNAFLKKETKIFLNEISFGDAVQKVLPHLWFLVLPILAIAGATILNNGGTNIVTAVTILSVAAFSLYAVAVDHSKRESLILTGVFCASLALLFVASMRSWHVVGWDINAELQVFRLTEAAGYWSMSHLQDAYNACLSITLLPTIFSSFVHIYDEYIYKFLFQIIFALMPISIFYFVRIFANARVALFAVVMLIGSVVFSHGMPALVRQEFGFLYFGLTLLVLFSSNLSTRVRFFLAIIYGFSIIVSHYSTTYITVFFLGSMVSLNFGLYLAKKRFPRLFPGNVSRTIGIWYVILLAIGTILWGSVITNTSNNLTGFFDNSKSNIAESFTYDTWSRAIAQVFSAYPHYEDFEQYKNEETIRFRLSNPDMIFYDDKLTSQETIAPAVFAQSPGLLGANVKIISSQVFHGLKLVLNNLFIVLGIILLIYQWYTKKFKSSEFIFLAGSGFLALGLILLLPDALTQYNIDRLYFQLLMIWALLSVTAGFSILSFLSNRLRFVVLGTVYCALMLFYSSLIFTITGGTPLLSMNNFGGDYEKFYAHDSEVAGARWLGKTSREIPIFANSSGYVRLRSHGNVLDKRIFRTILPSMIDKNSYVFLTHLNVVAGISTYLFYNEEYAYTAPIDFLNKNKDAIYDSGTSKVFR